VGDGGSAQSKLGASGRSPYHTKIVAADDADDRQASRRCRWLHGAPLFRRSSPLAAHFCATEVPLAYVLFKILGHHDGRIPDWWIGAAAVGRGAGGGG
jgi:hypothetical protein